MGWLEFLYKVQFIYRQHSNHILTSLKLNNNKTQIPNLSYRTCMLILVTLTLSENLRVLHQVKLRYQDLEINPNYFIALSQECKIL